MNLKEESLSFFPVGEEHRKLIFDWFEKDHVKEFYYGQGLVNTFKNLDLFVSGIRNNGEYSFEHWIAYIGCRPFGFLMTSLVEGPYNPDDHVDKWYEEGKETISLDMLIGPEEFLGKGLAHRMIQEFLLDKFPHAAKVLIDPEASNTKAIHVYEKAGFKKLEQFIPKYDPISHWMMILVMD